MRGRLPPGTPLRLDALSQELKMSISPVREAVRRLESLGLVDYEAHRGARVRPLSSEELRDIMDVRVALETIAIRRAAEAFSSEDGEVVQAALDRLDRAYLAPDIEEHLTANKDFHFAVYRAGRSPWLIRQLAPAWDTCERYAVALFGVDSLEGDRPKRTGGPRQDRAGLPPQRPGRRGARPRGSPDGIPEARRDCDERRACRDKSARSTSLANGMRAK